MTEPQRPQKVRVDADELELLRKLASDNEQERELARISENASSERTRLHAEAERAREDRIGLVRSTFWIAFTVAFVVAGLISLVVWIHRDDHRKQIQVTQIQQQTIQECIHAGNIWVNGDCLIARHP